MKTPEEIKKGLECCYGDAYKRLCEKCPNAVKVEGYSEIMCADFDSMGENALAYIKQLEAQVPKWISVEERLPDDLEEVLILVKETEFYGQYKEFSKSYFCQYIGCVDDGEWFTVWCHGHRYIKDTAKEPCADKLEVTHWMPLPEPPKEG